MNPHAPTLAACNHGRRSSRAAIDAATVDAVLRHVRNEAGKALAAGNRAAFNVLATIADDYYRRAFGDLT